MEDNNSSNQVAVLTKQVATLTKQVEALTNVLCTAKEVLNLEEAAIFLGIAKSSLYKMTHNQVIPFYKPNNKMVYFERSELLKWLRTCPVASIQQIDEEATRIERALALK